MINTFNTGRKYTEIGQRIAWTVIGSSTSDGIESSDVSFADCDRGIDGVVTIFECDPEHVRNSDVLRAYDNGGYGWDNARDRVAQLYTAAREAK